MAKRGTDGWLRGEQMDGYERNRWVAKRGTDGWLRGEQMDG
jgi:hypothetical protein